MSHLFVMRNLVAHLHVQVCASAAVALPPKHLDPHFLVSLVEVAYFAFQRYCALLICQYHEPYPLIMITGGRNKYKY